MSCLLPQFKCFPETFVVTFKAAQHHSSNSKSRENIHFRTQCVLSTMTSTKTSVLDAEKLQFSYLEGDSNSLPGKRPWKLPISTETTALLDNGNVKLNSVETHSNSTAANGEWAYTGAVGPPMEVNFRAALDTQSFLTSEEAVIAAAAAEAVALAKAALKVANDAAMIASGITSSETESSPLDIPSKAENIMFERFRPGQLEGVGIIGEPTTAEDLRGNQFLQYPSAESDDAEPMHEELKHLEALFDQSITVRSKRQIERKARRARAAEKAAASVVSIKSGSTSRKRRPPQHVETSNPLRYLQGATSTSRLLTSAEERKLSEGIQDLLKLERLQDELAQRCGCQPTFPQWAAAAGVDQKNLRKRINYGILCKHKMINSNIRLVRSIAKSYQGVGMNLSDLIQEGCRGLITGAEKFDASKGFKFSTYAHWWIKQSIRKYLSDQSRMIRLPVHMVDAMYRVKDAKMHFYTENGRHPDVKELAKATGLPVNKVSSVLQIPKPPRSLDQKIGFDENLKPSDVIADPDALTTEELLIKQFMRQDLHKVLNTLNPREKQVVWWRFGLEDGRMKTLQEIGELMGVSRERIRQIECCAFRKLKSKKRTNHLRQYIIS